MHRLPSTVMADCISVYLTMLYQLSQIKQVRIINNKVTHGEGGKDARGNNSDL